MIPSILVEEVDSLAGPDLDDLCDAASDAIDAGGGFGWLSAPTRDAFERYWQGVLVVPERRLFVGRLDGTIAAAAQLIRPPRNNEAQAHQAQLTGAFVAPWARGHGLARALTEAVEAAARDAGFRVLALDVRATQDAAIRLYEGMGFTCWGTNPCYAWINGQYVAGRAYIKELT
ncbi:MAG: GNAT family N-acetyltransferase [Alphaproteobacteria bacterium]|nr:GNAT family N-acetyltransferase [Alphaproteobacteria bacterium]TAD87094.1 MAG: GNAT family N-acetyltransferase [Alphaproteobacteria bacterium]